MRNSVQIERVESLAWFVQNTDTKRRIYLMRNKRKNIIKIAYLLLPLLLCKNSTETMRDHRTGRRTITLKHGLIHKKNYLNFLNQSRILSKSSEPNATGFAGPKLLLSIRQFDLLVEYRLTEDITFFSSSIITMWIKKSFFFFFVV